MIQYTTFPLYRKAFFTITLRLYMLYKLYSCPDLGRRGNYFYPSPPKHCRQKHPVRNVSGIKDPCG